MKRNISHQTDAKHNPYKAFAALCPIILFILILWGAKSYFGLEMSSVEAWLESLRYSPFAVPTLILIFILGSFLSLPQWALFISAMAVFGPLYGSLLSWGATLISASVNFGLGRRLGHKHLEAYVKEEGRVDYFLQRLRENGVLASFAVRFVPTGPFIFVNMLAGASGIKFINFVCGTAPGIIPKILVVALLTQGFITDDKRWSVMVGITFSVCVLFGLSWVIKRRLGRKI